MEFDAVLLSSRRARMIAHGFWHGRTINGALASCLSACPDKLALTALQVETGAITRFTYRELARMADRVAIGLSRLGVGRSDVVACQLPSWWQFVVTYLACSRIGAVMNPLMPIFRERELSFMLKHSEAKVVIIPKEFRGFDFEKMMTGLQPTLPHLQRIVVVGSVQEGQPAANSFEALLSDYAWENEADANAILTSHRPGPDDITQLMYTSGTTGEPKGVMHSANSLIATVIPFTRRLHLGENDIVLMASPLAHQSGFTFGMVLSIVLRAGLVLQDVWDPKRCVELIRTEKTTFTFAATPFLSDLTKASQETGMGVPSLRTFLCGGAPIPGPLVETARRTLGVKVASAWGMTEAGAITLTRPEDDDERAVQTDGFPLEGVEVKAVDSDGQALAVGETGKLMVRSCGAFGGYLKRPDLNATDAEDWFDTGDLGRIDAQGYIRIAGRSKDVIIRGGENIPVVEVEALLYLHSSVAKAAVVAYSDERLGERACAVVVVKPGHTIDLPSMVDFFKAQKMALSYIPERLLVLDDLPSTASGKIQKHKLRELLREAMEQK